MPTGARTAGVPSGPPTIPRLVSPSVSAVPAVLGQIFVPMEHNTISGSATADASGVAVVSFSVPLDRVWHIERISVYSASNQPTAATAYLDSADPANIVDLTLAGDGDVADEVNPILVPAGKAFLIKWISSQAGAVATARIQYTAGSYQQVPIGAYGGVS